MKALGRHLIGDFFDCDCELINDVNQVKRIMVTAAEIVKAHIVDISFHTFNPHGISGVIVIAESHLAIHTWPEYGYCSIDIYTCGDELDPWIAFEYMNKEFKAKRTSVMEMKRGMLNVPGNVLRHKPLAAAVK